MPEVSYFNDLDANETGLKPIVGYLLANRKPVDFLGNEKESGRTSFFRRFLYFCSIVNAKKERLVWHW